VQVPDARFSIDQSSACRAAQERRLQCRWMKALRPWHVDMLARFFPKIDEMLATQPFITGTEFTVADITLTCVLREIRKTEITSSYPNIENYRRRCEDRPAFVKVLEAYEDRLGIPRASAR
jgi:glutathione S-transferase